MKNQQINCALRCAEGNGDAFFLEFYFQEFFGDAFYVQRYAHCFWMVVMIEF